MKDIIKTPRGFVGTVNADWTSNLEPNRLTHVFKLVVLCCELTYQKVI
jgi:hypothetical protein